MPFTSELLKPDTWLIKGEGCSAYLVAGDHEGAMVDTGYAREDIHAYAESLCGKPVHIVMNTHGHFDHTGGNGYFKVAFMGRLAKEIAKEPVGGMNVEDYPLDYPIVVVDDGFTLDLGNREFEAFRMDGHSPDCIAWLDKRERILFTGDNMGPGVPMKYQCVDPQPSMLLFMQSVAKLLARREEYDWTAAGHGDRLFDADIVNHTMMAVLRALDGETDEMPPKPDPKPGEIVDKGPDFSGHNPDDTKCVYYKDSLIVFDKRYLKDTTRRDVVHGT